MTASTSIIMKITETEYLAASVIHLSQVSNNFNCDYSVDIRRLSLSDFSQKCKQIKQLAVKELECRKNYSHH